MINSIRCVILEDDPTAAGLLGKYVDETENAECVATFDRALDTQHFLLNHDAHLLITDIKLPDMDSLDMIESLPRQPLVILVTAHNSASYATKGYRLDVVDYLTKPLSYGLFKEAVRKTWRRLNGSNLNNDQLDDYAVFEQHGGGVKVYYSDIRYLESARNYTHVHLLGEDILLLRKPLQEVVKQLPQLRFLQIHKSYVVPLHLIAAFTAREVKLHHVKEVLPIGRTYKAQLKMRMVGIKQSKRL